MNVIITNIPTPYRNRVFDLLGNEYVILYSAITEKNRSWKFYEIKHNYEILRGLSFRRKDGFNFIHINYNIIKVL
jgi:hypothetical protein